MLNKTVLTLCCAATFMAAAPLAVSADTPPAKAPAAEHDHDHAQPPAGTKPKVAQPAVDAQMHRMQELHEKMMAAKTPEERKALMAEQRKAMQEGMAMMKDMKGMKGMGMDDSGGKAGMGGRHGMMEKRMDMMEMMMQMMMDQQGMGEAPANK